MAGGITSKWPGPGLSIAHIGHSSLAGSSIHLKNILHVSHISTHLLLVNRLYSDNDVFVEFHHQFYCVKDQATRKILLHGRSKGDLYPTCLVELHHLRLTCFIRCHGYVFPVASASLSSYQ
jgi:hypothetical protein